LFVELLARVERNVAADRVRYSMKTSEISPVKSKPAVKRVPDGMHTVTPYLVCAGASDAIAFYKKAFGATELMRLPTPDGKLMHSAIRIGDSVIMLNDEFPEMGSLGPKSRQGTSVTIHLCVEDADEWFARAVKAGATVKLPLQDMFWGDRYGQIEDPFGHNWSIATHIRDLTPDEIQEAARTACE
jgi:PhnB protein